MIKTFLVNMQSLLKGRKGQGMVEYGLLIGLIAVVVIGALTVLGPQVKALFNSVVTALGGTAA
jgi:pilus assembly protein Flp/PilA